MLVLGSQVLIGFQFRGLFNEGFADLPAALRQADGAAMLLLTAVMALLLVPGCFLRLAEHGENTARLDRLMTGIAEIILLPFAVSLGLDIAITAYGIFGMAGGVAGGLIFTAAALFASYGFGYLNRRAGKKQRELAMSRQKKIESEQKPTPLFQRIDQMLTEARVILPGVQALLGFQLISVFAKPFDDLPELSKLVHAAALGFLALAVILLMAPAAYHRIVFAGEDSEDMHKKGSWMVGWATLPLALGLSCEVYVALAKIADSALAGAVWAGLALLAFATLWYIYPLLARKTA